MKSVDLKNKMILPLIQETLLIEETCTLFNWLTAIPDNSHPKWKSQSLSFLDTYLYAKNENDTVPYSEDRVDEKILQTE